MNPEATLSLLAAQMERAKVLLLSSRASRTTAKGREAAAIQGIVDSLRLTLAAQLAGLDLGGPVPGRFLLRVGPDRTHRLFLDAQMLATDAGALERLFANAGLRLEPGQVLLLEVAAVRMLLEEAA